MKNIQVTPRARWLLLACGLLAQGPAFAQHAGHQEQPVPAEEQQSTPPNAGSSGQMGAMDMDHQHMGQQAAPDANATSSQGAPQQGMAHQQMQKPTSTKQQSEGQQSAPMSGMQMSPMQGAQQGTMPGMQMGAMQGMQMGPMQGGKPPPDARDPNAYAEGTRHANLPGNSMNDEAKLARLLVNSFEQAGGQGKTGQNLDAEAWYGGDFDKVWLKAEGERRDGRLESLRTEALWDHAIAPYWGTQLGVRHDTGGGEARNWLAFGVQGLAPYWFETEATAYWRPGGNFAARADVRYELLFTQRLILQPQLQANLYSRADPERGIGSGLSDLGFSLRLRYEIRRQFAPYIGVTWRRKFGGTARFAEQAGERRQTFQAVAGVRLWF